jgi:hypothetical protein
MGYVVHIIIPQTLKALKRALETVLKEVMDKHFVI